MDSTALSKALHSLKNPHFFSKSASRLPKSSKTAVSSVNTFDQEVKDRLNQLENSDLDFFSLSWLQKALDLVLYAFSVVLRTNLSFKDKEKAFIEPNIHDSLKLLDACNGLKEVMNDAQHYAMRVRYGTRIAMDLSKTPDDAWISELDRVKDAINKSVEFVSVLDLEKKSRKDGKSKMETCTSLLHTIGENAVESRFLSSNSSILQIHTSKMLSVFVCNLLAMAFSGKSNGGPATIQVPAFAPWSSSLRAIQNNVNKVACSRGNVDTGSFRLKEYDNVRGLTDELANILNTLSVLKSGPSSAGEKEELGNKINSLAQLSDELHQGLLVLQQQTDDLFRMLMAIRVNMLDALCVS